MSNNEELKKLMEVIPLTQAEVADLTESKSVDTVKGWCASKDSTRYRNMPDSKMKLLKIELKERGLRKSN